MLQQIVYVSRRLPTTDAAEVEHIAATARTFNAFNDVTGMLIVSDTWFLQVIEGDDVPIQRAFRRISLDQRHAELRLLAKGAIPARGFPDWEMATVDVVDAVDAAYAAVRPLKLPKDMTGSDEELLAIVRRGRQSLLYRAGIYEADPYFV